MISFSWPPLALVVASKICSIDCLEFVHIHELDRSQDRLMIDFHAHRKGEVLLQQIDRYTDEPERFPAA